MDGKDLEKYVEYYLGKYREVVEENLNLVHDVKHVFFKYNNSPKAVYGIISKTHGAAVVLKYDETEKAYWNVVVIDMPVEYYFWPNMSKELKNLIVIKVVGSDSLYVLDSQIIIRNFGLLLVSEGASFYYVGEEESPFKIEGPGAVVIFGELVSRSGLIMKGSNTKQAWSEYQAGLDALKHFFWDCYDCNIVFFFEVIGFNNISQFINSTKLNYVDGVFHADVKLFWEAGIATMAVYEIVNELRKVRIYFYIDECYASDFIKCFIRAKVHFIAVKWVGGGSISKSEDWFWKNAPKFHSTTSSGFVENVKV